MELLWDRGTQVCSNVPSHINKLAAMPIYGKNLKQSSSPKPKKPMTLNLGMHHRVLKYFQVCSNDDLGLTLTYHEKPEDHWSCIAHLSVEDILRSGLLRKRSLKVLNMSDLAQGQWMTLTFRTHKASCTHLIDCIYQFLYNRLQLFQKKIHCFTFFPIQKHKGPNLILT